MFYRKSTGMHLDQLTLEYPDFSNNTIKILLTNKYSRDIN